MNAEIISVGTELLLGDIVNTNAQFLAQELAALGVSVFYQTVVGDNHDRLEKAVKTAFGRSDIIVLTGGLGPTEDDLTKETVADAFGDKLVLDLEELGRLEKHFAASGRIMTENNKKQAFVPQNGFKLPNKNGTAPGVVFEKDGKRAFLLPGPPKEMRPMFAELVVPILQKGQDAVLCSLNLHVLGIGESSLEGLVAPLLQKENPTAALYSKTTEVYIRITARAKTMQQAKAMCQSRAKEFYSILGDNIYSDDNSSMEEIVVGLLSKQNAKIATAESCTGGMLSQMITKVPGASGVFELGICSYAGRMKQKFLNVSAETLIEQGEVSAETAAQMASGVLAVSGADIALATTGIAGPSGGSVEKPVGLVYVAAATKGKVYVRKVQSFSKNRDIVRRLACLNALDLARRLLLALPLEDVENFDIPKSQI